MKNDDLVILETSLDDLNPQFYNYLIKKLIKSGAKEALIQPIIMKKNRVGFLLTVIGRKKIKDKLIEKIFDETTAFGIRLNKVSHIELEREMKKVKTRYGLVKMKIGRYKGKIKTISPEYEDCEKIAEMKRIPLKKVYDEAKRNIHFS